MSKARDLADGTFDTDTLVVDAANNRVGIGTSSPRTTLNLAANNSGQGAVLTIENSDTSITTNDVIGQIDFYANDGSTGGTGQKATIQAISSNSSGTSTDLIFGTSPFPDTTATERARIDSSGNLLVGTTSVISGSVDGANICVDPINEGSIRVSRNSGSNSNQITFWNTNGKVGSITTVSTSTAYNTSSDYRLKENVVNLTDASDRINQIPVHRFNFIVDPDRTLDGFLAHEVQTVVPEAITGEHNEVDEDGNPVYQQIDQSKIVPLLTAALQEALSEIADLKTRVAALETP